MCKLRAGLILQLGLLLLFAGDCVQRPAHALGDVYEQARLLERQDDLPRALRLASDGLKRALEERNRDYYWEFRLLKAEVLLAQGDAAGALPLIEGEIPQTGSVRQLLARQWMDRGWAESSLSNFQKSLLSYQQALQFAQSAQSPSLTTEIRLRQGVSLLRLGNVSSSEKVFVSALEDARRQKDVYLEACALGDLALLRMNEARYDEAIDRFNEALALFEKIPSRRLIARTLNNLGYCELELGETEKALRLFQEASSRAGRSGLLSDQQVALGRIGDCYAVSGRLPDALAYYQRALELAQRTQEKFWIANWLYQLATISIQMGDLDEAERYNNQALRLQEQMQNPLERLYPLLNAARIAVLRQQMSKALALYRSVVAAAEAQTGIRDPQITLEARSGLARVLVATGRPDQAEVQWKKTLALIDTNPSALTDIEHRIAYRSSLVRFYQDYVDFLASKGRNAEALAVAESDRARLLSERLRGLDGPPARVSVSELRNLSRRSHTTLLAYWLAPRRSFLWVITPRGLATFVLPSQRTIASRVEQYRRAIYDLRDPLAAGDIGGDELYRMLLAPARSILARNSRVVIVPDGALYNLNFGTIPVPAPSRHYWSEDATISVAPSLSTLARHRLPVKPRPASLLLIGDPGSADQQRFPRLLNAGLEIQNIQAQFPASSEVALTGPSAEPGAYAAARPERFSLIHFAAHATANREDPLDSAIILSPHGSGYKLYARDVMRIPIHASVVTLSACQSAGAATYAGEGLVGFAWAFLRAGARHVIGGLWEVDDRSTSQLMGQLYRALGRGSEPAAALREAQLSLLKSGSAYRKPYYWAPFEVFTDSLGPPTGSRVRQNASAPQAVASWPRRMR